MYSIYTCTLEPLYLRHFGTLISVLNTEVSSIQRSYYTLQYYNGTQNGVLITEVSTFQRFIIERFTYNMIIFFSVLVVYHGDVCTK